MSQHESTARPHRRIDGLIVEPVAAELVVYDEVSAVAHCLSATAAAVWNACDGTRDVPALAQAAEVEEGIVTQALSDLEDRGLLNDDVTRAPDSAMPRRDAIKRFATIGAAAGSMSLVVSAILDTSLAHASMLGTTCTACTSSTDCATGYACRSNGVATYCVPEGCVFQSCTPGGTCNEGLSRGTCMNPAPTCGELCCSTT